MSEGGHIQVCTIPAACTRGHVDCLAVSGTVGWFIYTPVLVKGELCQVSVAEIVDRRAVNACTLRAALHCPTLSANSVGSCSAALSKTDCSVSTYRATAVDRDFDYSLDAVCHTPIYYSMDHCPLVSNTQNSLLPSAGLSHLHQLV